MPQPTGGEFDEIISRLKSIQQIQKADGDGDTKPAPIPLIDPTANVKELVDMERRHSRELRDADNQRLTEIRVVEATSEAKIDALREKLRMAESNRIDAVNLAERNRIDANVAQGKADIALASEKAGASIT